MVSGEGRRDPAADKRLGLLGIAIAFSGFIKTLALLDKLLGGDIVCYLIVVIGQLLSAAFVNHRGDAALAGNEPLDF